MPAGKKRDYARATYFTPITGNLKKALSLSPRCSDDSEQWTCLSRSQDLSWVAVTHTLRKETWLCLFHTAAAWRMNSCLILTSIVILHVGLQPAEDISVAQKEHNPPK
ncbi:hypothetical protein EYF80_037121 [Liparis tanakae]|uniref:Uncharacterized protein n=1 Tax=Liparis tanakae TaxID=230148 RepID=A0A4Z2GH83_9TELE|nr:hypothetical protein EYF80_037121 [Liparis tanakae]